VTEVTNQSLKHTTAGISKGKAPSSARFCKVHFRCHCSPARQSCWRHTAARTPEVVILINDKHLALTTGIPVNAAVTSSSENQPPPIANHPPHLPAPTSTLSNSFKFWHHTAACQHLHQSQHNTTGASKGKERSVADLFLASPPFSTPCWRHTAGCVRKLSHRKEHTAAAPLRPWLLCNQHAFVCHLIPRHKLVTQIQVEDTACQHCHPTFESTIHRTCPAQPAHFFASVTVAVQLVTKVAPHCCWLRALLETSKGRLLLATALEPGCCTSATLSSVTSHPATNW
jgi:hypothetical protein